MMTAWQQEEAGNGPACQAAGSKVRILDWVESQSKVTRIWLDELIAEGDPNDLVSVIHRQAAWLELMRDRLKQAS
ncbi:hypothetical protein [Henriciella sp.]|uniref:hypothetical protein n=1 Tax=Henriciella sp. TaxID=1968823 RepID=UPI0026164BAC|nr:hypothetical protein [Henriciella sp.]